MKDFIEDCIFSESMRMKWRFMLPDARITLTKAFDLMISCPDTISGYSSGTFKVSGKKITITMISIGYATFLLADNSTGKIALLDAALKDGEPVVDWRHSLRATKFSSDEEARI